MLVDDLSLAEVLTTTKGSVLHLPAATTVAKNDSGLYVHINLVKNLVIAMDSHAEFCTYELLATVRIKMVLLRLQTFNRIRLSICTMTLS